MLLSNLLERDRTLKRSFSIGAPSKLDPNWISGFTDAEGCFSVIISKKSAFKWRVTVSFEINLHTKDIAILHLIRDYFGVGIVSSRFSREICVYRVTSVSDLIRVIIPHFLAYPLLTQKSADFGLWSKVVYIMSAGDHLNPLGFSRVLSYYASINLGMSSAVSAAFPDIVGAIRQVCLLPSSLHPYWVSGFTAGLLNRCTFQYRSNLF